MWQDHSFSEEVLINSNRTLKAQHSTKNTQIIETLEKTYVLYILCRSFSSILQMIKLCYYAIP